AWTGTATAPEGSRGGGRDLPAELPADPPREVGGLQMPFAVSGIALSGPDQPGVDRRASTRLIFLDAVDPQPKAGEFPEIKIPEWVVEPRLRGLPEAANVALRRTLSIQ